MKVNENVSVQFNQELEHVIQLLMKMGGMVEDQLECAIIGVCDNDGGAAETVLKIEPEVDELEIRIEELCTHILIERQPTARELRMVLAISRITRDLERMGDQAFKVAQQTLELMNEGSQISICRSAIRNMGENVSKMLNNVLNAFLRSDTQAALEVVRSDKVVDERYGSAIRELSTYMMEDPRSIGQTIHILWMLRAIERIGDHARNISEQIIYLVSGEEVRHSTLSEMEQQVSDFEDQGESEPS
ncbi:MAG: phosphate signaling complex protein PhoU [Pseudomonadota bacterium]|nr:phosphate signaling complex protein PhoU [Pseudomonadota bacterium]